MRKASKWTTFIISMMITGTQCLSLDDIHSSSQAFKNAFAKNNDKSLERAIDDVRQRRQEFSYSYDPISLPVYAAEYYKRTLKPRVDQHDETLDVPLGYNQIESNYLAEPSTNDLFSAALAIKLSELLRQNGNIGSNRGVGAFQRVNIKRKRSAPRRVVNNRHNLLPNSTINNKNNKNRILTKSINGRKIKYIPKLVKSKAKRKSGRRVLSDHLKPKNNNAVIVKSGKQVKSQKSTAVLPRQRSPLSSKPITSLPKVGDNSNRQLKAKSITKRKVPIDTTIASNKINATEETDVKIVKELNGILADDAKSVRKESNPIESEKQKVRSNLKSADMIKKKNKRSSGNVDDIVEETDSELIAFSDPNIEEQTNSEAEEVKEKQNDRKSNFEEWLRREYYNNIAKSLATMRRKRSENDYLFSDDESDAINPLEDTNSDNSDGNSAEDTTGKPEADNSETKNVYKVDNTEENDDYVLAADDNELSNNDDDESLIWSDSGEQTNEQSESRANRKDKRSVWPYGPIDSRTLDESQRFVRIDSKLQNIEDALISEAIDLIQDSARKGSQIEAEKYRIENRLDAAYDIEDMRSSLDNLHNTIEKMKLESDNDLDDNDIETITF